VTAANTPLPAVTLSWLLPPTNDADHAVVNVIDGLLSGGESSRLYQALVYRDRVASEADVSVDFRKGPACCTAYAVLAGGKDPAAAGGGAAARDRPVARCARDGRRTGSRQESGRHLRAARSARRPRAAPR
jgi:zinc protease